MARALQVPPLAVKPRKREERILSERERTVHRRARGLGITLSEKMVCTAIPTTRTRSAAAQRASITSSGFWTAPRKGPGRRRS